MFLDRVHFISYSTKTPVDSLSNIQNNYDIILELSGACERSGRQLDQAVGSVGSQDWVICDCWPTHWVHWIKHL